MRKFKTRPERLRHRNFIISSILILLLMITSIGMAYLSYTLEEFLPAIIFLVYGITVSVLLVLLVLKK